MMGYIEAAGVWVASNAVALCAGGYVAYRFRAQIDAMVAKAEAVFAKV
jgi:hypothetical protein